MLPDTQDTQTKMDPNPQLTKATKVLSVIPGTASEEKTGGNPTPSSPSIKDVSSGSNPSRDLSLATAIQQDPTIAANERVGYAPAIDTPKPMQEIPLSTFLPPTNPSATPSVAPKTVPTTKDKLAAINNYSTLPASGVGKTPMGYIPTDIPDQNIPTVSQNPSFWEKALAVAKSTGKSIAEIIADMAQASQGKETYTERKMARDADINKIQLQGQMDLKKEMLSQEFQSTQGDLNRKLEAARTDIERQQLQVQLAQNQRNFEIEMSKLGLGQAQAQGLPVDVVKANR